MCMTQGFQNIATAELCARWISVGAWQPFTRDHHAQSFQELYRWVPSGHERLISIFLWSS